MTQGIDFLKPKSVGNFRFYYQAALLKASSLALLIAYCLVLLATTAFSFNLGQTKKALITEIQGKNKKIEQLKKVESRQTVLKQRLSLLAEFRKKESFSYAAVIEEILKITQLGVGITDLSLGEKKSALVEGSVSSSAILDVFLNRLNSEPLFSRATLSSLIKQENGDYLFSLSLEVADHD